MGNLCYCCLSEGDKVGKVLNKFPGQPVRNATPGMLQKLVGRVVLAGTNPFYSPANNKPCVYYLTSVEQEMREKRPPHPETGQPQPDRVYWKTIARKEQFTDFYLQDGTHKLFVKGSQRSQCKVQSGSETAHASTGWNVWQGPPPYGIQQMINGAGKGGWSWQQQKYRYTERRFDVNEVVAALGVVTASQDPYTQQAISVLNPINGNVLNEKYFEENKWEDFDKRSWHDLVTKSPSVLLSDSPTFTAGIQVAPIQNLPVWMTTYDVKYQAVQWGGAAVVAAPMVVQAPVMAVPQPQMMVAQPQMMVAQPQVVAQPQMMVAQPQMIVPTPQVVVAPQMGVQMGVHNAAVGVHNAAAVGMHNTAVGMHATGAQLGVQAHQAQVQAHQAQVQAQQAQVQAQQAQMGMQAATMGAQTAMMGAQAAAMGMATPGMIVPQPTMGITGGVQVNVGVRV